MLNAKFKTKYGLWGYCCKIFEFSGVINSDIIDKFMNGQLMN